MNKDTWIKVLELANIFKSINLLKVENESTKAAVWCIPESKPNWTHWDGYLGQTWIELHCILLLIVLLYSSLFDVSISASMWLRVIGNGLQRCQQDCYVAFVSGLRYLRKARITEWINGRHLCIFPTRCQACNSYILKFSVYKTLDSYTLSGRLRRYLSEHVTVSPILCVIVCKQGLFYNKWWIE